MSEWICVDCGDGRCEDCLTRRCDHDCDGSDYDPADDGPPIGAAS